MRLGGKKLIPLLGMITVVALVVGFCTRPCLPLFGNWWRMTPFYRRVVQHNRFDRPPGMAPAAYGGYLRACSQAQVHPWRVTQTIGNHPRSVGYHLRDGSVVWRGKRYDYCAAVDINSDDLNRKQINGLLKALGQQGFAAWYREGPKWRNGEHIHAVYAPLPMKPQLQRQVRLWISQRRKAGEKAYSWERKYRRYWS